MSIALTGRSIVSAAPAYSVAAGPAYSVAAAPAPAYSIAAAPAQAYSIAAAPAQAYSIAAPAPVAVAAAPVLAGNPWSDYSPSPVVLGLPALPAPDYRCYAPPQVPPGQNRLLRVDEPAALRNLEQTFNDVRTAVRENNTHVQRNRTQVTNINRNHNHLLRIVTNENNFEHNLTNQVVRVADIHRQRVENVAGQRRNFRDFKATQRVENLGCRRADLAVVAAAPVAVAAPAPVAVAAAPAITVAGPAVSVAAAPAWGPNAAQGAWVGAPAQWI